MFNPYNWYWYDTTIGLFSSQFRKLVTNNDEAFQAWRNFGNEPTPWPCDVDGKPSIRALDEVLAPYGLTTGLDIDLHAYTASKRYQIETGGITFNSMKIATERESQSMVGNAVQMVKLTGKPVQFKTADGFIELSPEQMQNVAVTVASHVQACFTAEADVQAKIKSGEIDSVDKIDAYPWPGSPA